MRVIADQPASSLLRAAARFTARMKAPRTPLLSSSARPSMVVPAGLATLRGEGGRCTYMCCTATCPHQGFFPPVRYWFPRPPAADS